VTIVEAQHVGRCAAFSAGHPADHENWSVPDSRHGLARSSSRPALSNPITMQVPMVTPYANAGGPSHSGACAMVSGPRPHTTRRSSPPIRCKRAISGNKTRSLSVFRLRDSARRHQSRRGQPVGHRLLARRQIPRSRARGDPRSEPDRSPCAAPETRPRWASCPRAK